MPEPTLDACQICHGTQGGVPGNENRLDDGTVLCDYCDAFRMKIRDAERDRITDAVWAYFSPRLDTEAHAEVQRLVASLRRG